MREEGSWMSGVTAAPQVLVRCATLQPRVGHTFMRHLLRGAVPGTFTGSASDCNSTSSSAAAVAPGHSCHQGLPLSTLFSGSKPYHRALRLLHQRWVTSISLPVRSLQKVNYFVLCCEVFDFLSRLTFDCASFEAFPFNIVYCFSLRAVHCWFLVVNVVVFCSEPVSSVLIAIGLCE